MATGDHDRQSVGHRIDVVRRADVEDYAVGRPQADDTIELIEQALLDDDAARDVVRQRAYDPGAPGDDTGLKNLPCEPLQDLLETATCCSAHAKTYERLCSQLDQPDLYRFAKRRRTAFCRAADCLAHPLTEERITTPYADTTDAALSAGVSVDGLARQICRDPASALHALEEFHWPLMRKIRTLIHRPWSIAAKLQIAEAYAELREELESGAWHLRRWQKSRDRHHQDDTP